MDVTKNHAKRLLIGETLKDRISSRNNNLTILRLFAAYLVLIGHSWTLTLGQGHHDPVSEIVRPIMPWSLGLPGIAVSMFFLFSGLLITRSYLNRDKLVHFLEARFLRLYPALIVCVLFCVFVVGLIQTAMPSYAYLSQPATLSYIIHNTTLVFGVDFRLPGLFSDSPFKGINGSLWTLPYEAWMYLLAATLGIFSILKHRWAFNLFFTLTILVYVLGEGYPGLAGTSFERLGFFFLLGAFVYINSSWIRVSAGIMVALMSLSWILFDTWAQTLVMATTIAYTMLVIGFSSAIHLPNMDKIGDFSYGTYLYAFPIQQTLINQIEGAAPWQICMLTMLMVTPIAVASWVWVERPPLKLKGHLSKKLDPRVWIKSNSGDNITDSKA